MDTLLFLLAVLVVWVIGYRILGRLFFPDRRRRWEVMEDMFNEGAQTSCLLLVSGVVAVVVGFLTLLAVVRL